MAQDLELQQILEMNKKEVAQVFRDGHPIKLEEIENTKYLGIDLSMPNWFHKYFWKTFRKTFYRDPETNVFRGWNVKLEQTGWEGNSIPKRNKKGEELSFGHYHLCDAKGKKFPKGWQGQDYLDYTIAGNNFFDPGKLGYCPLVAVNEGSTELLMGWEVFKITGIFLPLPDYWLLKKDGELETIVKPPARK